MAENQPEKPLVSDHAHPTLSTSSVIENIAEKHIPRVSAVFAIIVQLIVIALIIIFACLDVYIENPGQLSNTDRLLYVTGTTVLATCIASFTTGIIRELWFLRVVSSPNDRGNNESRKYAKARMIVGLGSYVDRIRFWPVSLSLTITALMTSAMVASVTPTDFLVIKNPTAYISLDHTNEIYTDSPCLIASNNSTSLSGFIWQMANGSYLTIKTELDLSCDVQNVDSTLLNQRYQGQGDAYIMGGVPVLVGAAGTPFGLENGFVKPFGIMEEAQTLSTASPLLNWASQCLPVVSKNPVQCQQTGQVTINGNNITVEANGCTIVNSGYVNPKIQDALVSGACTGDITDMGQATIVFGATNTPAYYLASAMNVHPLVAPVPSPYTFAVACSVDIAPSVSFSQLNLSRNNFDSYAATYSSGWLGVTGGPFQVSSTSDSCTPISNGQPLSISQLLTDSMLATGAAGSWQFLTTNPRYDGSLVTLLDIAYQTYYQDIDNSSPQSNYTWTNSRNYLEDLLGLSSAISLAYFWGFYDNGAIVYWNPINPENATVSITNGALSLSGVRVGSGSELAILYILPELFTVVLVLILLWRSRHL